MTVEQYEELKARILARGPGGTMHERTPIDKAAWGAGPWLTEPDRLEWEHAGLPCLAVRSELGGNWCGYAAVPPGHPLHGAAYGAPNVEVHGGLTYADACDGPICHVPKPGEPDDVWWFGFDCGHCFDVMPAMDARMAEYGHPPVRLPGTAYRTLEYVQAEANRLADQLAAIAKATA